MDKQSTCCTTIEWDYFNGGKIKLWKIGYATAETVWKTLNLNSSYLPAVSITYMAAFLPQDWCYSQPTDFETSLCKKKINASLWITSASSAVEVVGSDEAVDLKKRWFPGCGSLFSLLWCQALRKLSLCLEHEDRPMRSILQAMRKSENLPLDENANSI